MITYKNIIDGGRPKFKFKDTLAVVGANHPIGKFILENRDGEMDFDGFHHAYIKNKDGLFLVPLWEWAEEE